VKVLLTGATGQLGQALRRSCPPWVDLIASSRHGGPGLIALDLEDARACRAAVQEQRPDWVINAAAYTAVDQAEQEQDRAWAINADAPAALAEALADPGRLRRFGEAARQRVALYGYGATTAGLLQALALIRRPA